MKIDSFPNERFIQIEIKIAFVFDKNPTISSGCCSMKQLVCDKI